MGSWYLVDIPPYGYTWTTTEAFPSTFVYPHLSYILQVVNGLEWVMIHGRTLTIHYDITMNFDILSFKSILVILHCFHPLKHLV